VATALSLYLSNVAETASGLTAANTLYITSGAATTSENDTTINASTGYGELVAQGSTAAWPALGSLPALDGRGFFLDATVLNLVGQQIIAGNWSATQRIGVTAAATATADYYCRAAHYSAGVYTLLTTLTVNKVLSAGASTDALFPSTAGVASPTFASGDMLYVQYDANFTANAGTTGQSARLGKLSTDASKRGSTSAIIVTPGYQAAGSTNVNVLLTEQLASASAEVSVAGAGAVLLTEQLVNVGAESIVAGAGAFLLTERIASASAETGVSASAPTTNVNVLLTEQLTSASAEVSVAGAGAVLLTEALASASAETSSAGTGAVLLTEQITSASAEVATLTTASVLLTEQIASASAEASVASLTTVSVLLTERISSASAEATTLASSPPVVYTNSSVTVTVNGTAVMVREGSYALDDSINAMSTLLLTVRDDTGLNHYKRGNRISASDSVRGLLYNGFVMTSQEQNFRPNSYIESQLAAIDNHYLLDKRTYSGPEYTQQYAGAILADQIAQLASEGITAQIASVRETTQANFALGTLSNVVAATNQGNGDLELAASGTVVSHTEDLTSGTLTNMQNVGAALTLQSVPALKLTGYSSQGVAGTGTTHNYMYVELWTGSVVFAAGDYLQYDLWISSTSPEIKAGLDGICTDNTTLRDGSSGIFLSDQNALKTHPNTDLSGYANDQWYTRTIQIVGPYVGKTLGRVTVAIEGSTAGNYTAYFRNAKLYASGGTVKQTFFATTLGSVGSATTVLSNSGYSRIALSVVTSYQQSGWRVSPATSIASVGIVRSSLASWQATTPPSTLFFNEVSVDGGATWQAMTRSQPLASLLAGANTSGLTLTTRQRMLLTGTSPETTPVLSSQIWTVQPSYAATKSDFLHTETSTADFAGGSNTNVQSNAGQLSLQGAWRTWDDANLTGQTVYSTFGGGAQYVTARQLSLPITGVGSAIVSQFNFAGTWQNFTAEFDLAPTTHGTVSLSYRTTNQGTGKNSGAYIVDIAPTNISLGYGANNGASTAQGYANLANIALALNGNFSIRLKVVVSGSTHRAYLDDVLQYSVTDSTYSAAGYFAARFLLTDSAAGTFSGFFKNFGVMSSFTGSHKTGPFDVSALGTLGTSVLLMDADIPTSGAILVETSFDNSTWSTAPVGQPLPGLTAGTVNGNTQMWLRATLSTGNASPTNVTGRDGNVYVTPTLHGITVWATNQLNAAGNRVGPVLSIGTLQRIGSTLVAWNVLTPPGTSVGVDVRVDGGAWSDVSASNGGSVPGLNGQPLATIDGYATNTSANYTNTFRTGGSVATWAGDTTNDRIVASAGAKALYINNLVSCGDMSMTVDMDYSDTGGYVWHYTSTSNYYECVVQDGAGIGGGAPDSIALYSIKAGVRTLLQSVGIVFNRLEKHRFTTMMAGNTITTIVDGVTVWTYADSAILASGKCGLRTDGGTARFYQLYIQPLGDNAGTHTIQTRQRLTSSDPTQTPQFLDTTLAAFGESIAVGALIPKTSYHRKYYTSNVDDLAKQSNYWWYISAAKSMTFLPRTARLAPWIASDTPGDFLEKNISITNQSDLYRNRQIITNVLATAPINESRVGDGYTQTWTFAYGWASAPAITVNGVAALVGVKGVDTGKQFYWLQGDPTITQDPSQPLYDNSIVIAFVGTGQYFTESVYDDLTGQGILAALEASSGIVENVEDGKGIPKAAGDALAQARVVEYGVFGLLLTATTRRVGLAPGHLLTVYLAPFGIAGLTFLIRSVKTALQTEFGGQQPIMLITAVSGAEVGDWTRLFAH